MSWPTPQARDGDARRSLSSPEGARRRFQQGRRNLTDAASMLPAGDFWPTPTATDYGSSQNGINGIGGEFERPSANTPSLSTRARYWPTPVSRDAKGSQVGFNREGAAGLPDAVRALWPTPTAGDGESSGSRNLEGSTAHPGVSLTDSILSGTSTVSRRARPGSANGMVLNPLFVEAMMGFPPGWTEGGVRRTGAQTDFDFSAMLSSLSKPPGRS